MNRPTISSTERLRKLVREEDGSAVLEASLVFPLLLASIMAMMLLALLVYQKAGLYYAASVTGERAAYHWDNSKRQPVSGIVSPGSRDGLYWRLTDDSMLEAIFGWSGGADRVTAVLPSGGDEGNLAWRKMTAAAGWLPPVYTGEISYAHNPLLRELRVSLSLSGGFARRTGALLNGNARNTVVEPAEFIRTVDLARYYQGKFGGGSEAADKRRQAADVLAKLGSGVRGSGS